MSITSVWYILVFSVDSVVVIVGGCGGQVVKPSIDLREKLKADPYWEMTRPK